jgi:predicted ArsR family transcriptional regulator
MDYRKMFDKIFPEFPRVRSTDPVTSFEAADSIKEIAPQHHDIILACLAQHGALGKDGIAAHTKLDSNQVSRRLNEMKARDLIELTGRTVKSNSGRNEREWRVKISISKYMDGMIDMRLPVF